MRCAAAVSLVVVGLLLVSPANAQKDSTKPPQTEFTGCVSGERTPSGTFTLTDTQNGGKYRLNGKKIERYAGKMVAIVSGPTKRVAVMGGLWPSPNTA